MSPIEKALIQSVGYTLVEYAKKEPPYPVNYIMHSIIRVY